MSGSMLDPGIALRAGAGVVPLANPLDTYGKVQGLQSQQLQNQLLGNANQQYLAKRAAGQAFLAAQNPDGTPNQGRFMQGMAADPTTASAALEAGQQGQTLATANLGFNTAQQTRLAGTVGSMLSQPNSAQTPEAYAAILKQELGAGTLDQSHYDNAVSHMPPAGAGPDAFRGYATRMLVGALGGPQMAQTLLPQNTITEDGQTITPQVRNSAISGASPGAMAPAAGSVQLQTGPGFRQGLVEVTDPVTGAKSFKRNQDVVTVPGPMGTGRRPAPGSPLLNPNRPPDAAPPPDVAAQSPSDASSMNTKANQAAGAFQEIAKDRVTAQNQSAVLGNLKTDLMQFDPGAGQQSLNAIKAAIVSRAPGLVSGFGINPSSVASAESYDKLFAQLSDAQGAGSDARLAVNAAANPASSHTREGLNLMISQLQGNADYKQARGALAATYPNQKDNAKFEDEIGQQLDPRAFQMARMTPTQQHQYFTNIPDAADRAKVKASYIFARDKHLIGGANAGQ